MILLGWFWLKIKKRYIHITWFLFFIMTNSKMLTIRRLFIGKFLTSGARVGKIEVEKQWRKTRRCGRAIKRGVGWWKTLSGAQRLSLPPVAFLNNGKNVVKLKVKRDCHVTAFLAMTLNKHPYFNFTLSTLHFTK